MPAAFVAVFGASSAALGSLSGPRKAALRETLSGKNRAALDRYLDRSSQTETSWLVLRVVGIATSAALLARMSGAGSTLGTALLSAFAALVAYGIPAEVLKGLALRAPERSAVIMLRVLYPFELAVAPIAAPLSLLGRLAGRTTPAMTSQTQPPPGVTETEVEILVNEGERAGAIDPDQAEMVRNVLEFRDLTAGEAMVPRTQVTALDVATPVEELLRRVVEYGHSRYPVYRERIDNVIGLLHAKDLLSYAANHDDVASLDIETILRRPVAFVPETREASKVLKDMRAGRHHLAIVIDEFGGMSGIVTLEDLVEEIVGDIQDEHDLEEQPIVALDEHRYLVAGTTLMEDLNRELDQTFPEDEDYNTVGGFLMDRLGRIPGVGAKVTARGWVFTVREADERRVIRVELAPLEGTERGVSPKSPRVSAA